MGVVSDVPRARLAGGWLKRWGRGWVLVAALVLVCLCVLLARGFERKPRPGVLVDELGLLRKSFWRSRSDHMSWGIITHLQVGDYDSDGQRDVAVFDQTDLYITNAEGMLREAVWLQWPMDLQQPALLQVPGERRFVVIVRVGWRGGVGLMDGWGKVLWQRQDLLEIAPGDLDRDGVPELYTPDVFRMDLGGSVAWAVWGADDIAVLDGPGVERRAVVVFDWSGGRMRFLDHAGHCFREVSLAVGLKHCWRVEACEWPTPGHFLTADGGAIYLFGTDGELVLSRRSVEGVGYIHDFGAAVVQFTEGGERYLAVVTSHQKPGDLIIDRAVLAIFGPTGRVVYEEVLGQTTGICVLSGVPGRKNRLLVGNGGGRVYSYEQKDGR